MVLLVAFPQIQDQAEGHQPHFVLRHSQMRQTVIKQSGKQFLVCYPTATFFASFSLSIFRLVPLYIAWVIAAL